MQRFVRSRIVDILMFPFNGFGVMCSENKLVQRLSIAFLGTLGSKRRNALQGGQC
jgi:hypothetical protein